jgi:hypothetical protein
MDEWKIHSCEKIGRLDLMEKKNSKLEDVPTEAIQCERERKCL